jgi:hypothetical protein
MRICCWRYYALAMDHYMHSQVRPHNIVIVSVLGRAQCVAVCTSVFASPRAFLIHASGVCCCLLLEPVAVVAGASAAVICHTLCMPYPSSLLLLLLLRLVMSTLWQALP